MQISGGVQLSGGVNLAPGGESGPSASLQGSNFGYTTGGEPRPSVGNIIDKFSFSSNGNATDVADLAFATQNHGSNSSSTSGYTAGGEPSKSDITKFTFSTDSNSSSVANLNGSRFECGSCCC